MIARAAELVRDVGPLALILTGYVAGLVCGAVGGACVALLAMEHGA